MAMKEVNTMREQQNTTTSTLQSQPLSQVSLSPLCGVSTRPNKPLDMVSFLFFLLLLTGAFSLFPMGTMAAGPHELGHESQHHRPQHPRGGFYGNCSDCTLFNRKYSNHP